MGEGRQTIVGIMREPEIENVRFCGGPWYTPRGFVSMWRDVWRSDRASAHTPTVDDGETLLTYVCIGALAVIVAVVLALLA